MVRIGACKFQALTEATGFGQRILSKMALWISPSTLIEARPAGPDLLTKRYRRRTSSTGDVALLWGVLRRS